MGALPFYPFASLTVGAVAIFIIREDIGALGANEGIGVVLLWRDMDVEWPVGRVQGVVFFDGHLTVKRFGPGFPLVGSIQVYGDRFPLTCQIQVHVCSQREICVFPGFFRQKSATHGAKETFSRKLHFIIAAWAKDGAHWVLLFAGLSGCMVQ